MKLNKHGCKTHHPLPAEVGGMAAIDLIMIVDIELLKNRTNHSNE